LFSPALVKKTMNIDLKSIQETYQATEIKQLTKPIDSIIKIKKSAEVPKKKPHLIQQKDAVVWKLAVWMHAKIQILKTLQVT